MSTLALTGLGKSYRGVPALTGFDLTVRAGSRTAVVGPSGSGKTTLLRLVAGFERPDHGRIVLGSDVLADGDAAVPTHRRAIGIVAQEGALFPHLSLAENIAFGLPRRAPGRDETVAALMDTVELARAWRDKRPHELSGGQQQRAALARALALKPRLMLLDEPFSALDAGLRELTRRAVGAVLAEAGITTILVTHDQAEALSFADQVAVLREGRLVQAGAPADLYRRPADPAVATLLGDAVILQAEIRPDGARCALGRVPVATMPAPGPARIMLRPEQLAVGAAGSGGPEATRGRVVAIEFGGGTCLLTVAPDAAPSCRIAFRTPNRDLPEIGDAVDVSVRGTAHVFAERSRVTG